MDDVFERHLRELRLAPDKGVQVPDGGAWDARDKHGPCWSQDVGTETQMGSNFLDFTRLGGKRNG